MKRLRIIFPILLFLLLLTACDADGLYSLTIITEGHHELTQTLQGDLLVLGGEVTLRENIPVDGNVHLLLGKLVANGQINGDVSFVNGDLILGPSARVGGNLNLGSGSFHASPDSVIDGKVNTGAGVSLPPVPERNTPTSWSFWFQATLNGLFSGFISSALVRYFPSHMHRISETVTHHSLASVAMGILVGIVGISLLVTMAYTLLLIPVSILILFLLAVGVFLGWVGLGSELGRLLAPMITRSIPSTRMTFIGMFIFMFVFRLFTSIPMLGGLFGITLASLGLGAASLTRFGLREFVPATNQNLSE